MERFIYEVAASIFISLLVKMYEFHTPPDNPEYCLQKQQRLIIKRPW